MREKYPLIMQKRFSLAADSDGVTALTVRACAKVNLSLYVTGKRKDGMHNLVTTFASVNVADIIQVSCGWSLTRLRPSALVWLTPSLFVSQTL